MTQLHFDFNGIISTLSLLVGTIALIRTFKTQRLQDRINEIEIVLKNAQLEKLNEANRVCIEAKIDRATSGAWIIRVWNSGNKIARNVDIEFEKDEEFFNMAGDLLPYEELTPGKSFDIPFCFIDEMKSKFHIYAHWEDEENDTNSKGIWLSIPSKGL